MNLSLFMPLLLGLQNRGYAKGVLEAERNVYQKVIIDTDPGADDAMAIFMMLSPKSKVNVLAITTVTGNTGAQNASRNALKVLSTAKRLDIPVYQGSAQGLVYYTPSDGFFGEDGFGDFKFQGFLPPEKIALHLPAAEALVELVKRFPGEITLLSIGPLTNVAIALHLYPTFLSTLKQFVVLGGSYTGQGNVRPGVEFNIYSDPEAAAFVFSQANSEYPIAIVPLETVVQVGFPMEWRRNVLGKYKSPAIQLLNDAERKALRKEGNEWYPYDQSAASVVLKPDIVLSRLKVKVRVETSGFISRGAFILDYKSNLTNAVVITGINKTELQDLLIDRLT